MKTELQAQTPIKEDVSRIDLNMAGSAEKTENILVHTSKLLDENTCLIQASQRMQIISISQDSFMGYSINELSRKSLSMAVWLFTKKKNPFKILYQWQKWVEAGGPPIRIWFQDPELNQLPTPLEVRMIPDPTLDQNDNSIWLLVKDLTDVWEKRKRCRNKLQRVKKQYEQHTIDFASWLHDWKGPLSTIESSAWLCLRYRNTEDGEKQIKHLQKIARAVNEMKTGLIDWQTWHQPPSIRCIKRINIHSLVQERIAQLILKPSQTIDFLHQGNKFFNTDSIALQHILDNLLSNASKYSPDHTPISIKTWNSNSILQIAITDQGIGIPQQEIDRLFEARYRASNALDMPGNGLGLSTVHRLVKELGGTIQISSQINQGTTFTITLKNQLQTYEKSTDHRRQQGTTLQHC
jgi:signal transduction histidine kinase